MARLFAVCLTLPLLFAVSVGVRAASSETKARLRVLSSSRRGGWSGAPALAQSYDLREARRVVRIYF